MFFLDLPILSFATGPGYMRVPLRSDGVPFTSLRERRYRRFPYSIISGALRILPMSRRAILCSPPRSLPPTPLANKTNFGDKLQSDLHYIDQIDQIYGCEPTSTKPSLTMQLHHLYCPPLFQVKLRPVLRQFALLAPDSNTPSSPQRLACTRAVFQLHYVSPHSDLRSYILSSSSNSFASSAAALTTAIRPTPTSSTSPPGGAPGSNLGALLDETMFGSPEGGVCSDGTSSDACCAVMGAISPAVAATVVR